MVARFGHARTALNVARGAGARAHAGVTERRADEACVTLVAGVARSRGGHVVRRFAQCIPLGIGTVVAGAALTGNDPLGGGMGEGRGRERSTRGMAGIA